MRPNPTRRRFTHPDPVPRVPPSPRPPRRWLAAATATALTAAWLALTGCDQQRAEKLEEGVSTEVDVRRQFGEPVQITERADGSKVLEYPRQPEGSTNYLIEIGADGKMSALRQLLTPVNFAKVQPGMAQVEVRKLLGRPAKQNRFALKPDEEVWDWRWIDRSTGDQRKVFSVTFDRDGRVLRSGSVDDPRDLHDKPGA